MAQVILLKRIECGRRLTPNPFVERHDIDLDLD